MGTNWKHLINALLMRTKIYVLWGNKKNINMFSLQKKQQNTVLSYDCNCIAQADYMCVCVCVCVCVWGGGQDQY